MKTTTFPLKNSRKRWSCPLALLLIPLALAWFALSPTARAACQEGCDTSNNNTFLGEDALINNTTGIFNTATDYLSERRARNEKIFAASRFQQSVR